MTDDRTTTILLTGYPGAGKSTLARLLYDRRAWHPIDVAAVLERALRGKGIVPRNRSEVGPLFLRHFVEGEIFDALRHVMPSSGCNVVDAIRLPSTCRQFMAWCNGVRIWYVDASPEVRTARLRRRIQAQGLVDRNDAAAALKKYRAYDGVQESVRELAHLVIDNNDDLRVLEERADSLVENLQPS
jgi:dephospho-CoA kinase